MTRSTSPSAAQSSDALRDVGGAAHGLREDDVGDVFEVLHDEAGVDGAGRDGGNGDAGAGELLLQRERERAEAELGGGVDGLVGDRDAAGDRRDVHDRARVRGCGDTGGRDASA